MLSKARLRVARAGLALAQIHPLKKAWHAPVMYF